MVCGQDTSAEARVCAPAYAHACVCVCQDGSHGGQDRVLRHPDAMPRKAPFYADIVRSDSPARAARATSAWGGAARHPHAGVARALWDAAGAPLCRLLQSLPAFRPLLHRTFFTLIAASILAGAHSLSNDSTETRANSFVFSQPPWSVECRKTNIKDHHSQSTLVRKMKSFGVDAEWIPGEERCH